VWRRKVLPEGLKGGLGWRKRVSTLVRDSGNEGTTEKVKKKKGIENSTTNGDDIAEIKKFMKKRQVEGEAFKKRKKRKLRHRAPGKSRQKPRVKKATQKMLKPKLAISLYEAGYT